MRFSDTEGGVRTWLRVHPGVSEELHGRVFFDVPAGSPQMPLATVGRIGGGALPGEAPLESPRISISVWARTKGDAINATIAVCEALSSECTLPINDSVYYYDGTVDTVVWKPDNEMKLARYVIDATLVTRGV